MTWQRIDENTYIDNTLVTCAEYQLFIDDMLEQGKYYQPDHWTSCQFPKGQAREPILGVRFSDAEDFCVWLTKREASEWRYQLPTDIEANKYPLKSKQNLLHLGFWVMDAGAQPRFAWIDIMPVDPRWIAFGLDRNLAPALVLAIGHDRFDRALNRACDLDISRLYTIPRETTISYENAIVLDRVIDWITDRSPQSIDHTRALAWALERSRDLVNELGDFAVDLYVDIFTIQERIAGHSPAFEGIRLVKERIR